MAEHLAEIISGQQVSRTFYARGQTGQQLLLGAYSALIRQMSLKMLTLSRKEMLDLITIMVCFQRNYYT